MSSYIRRGALACALALSALAGARPAAAVPETTACVDRSSPAAGLDRRVAVAAFGAMGMPAHVVSYDGSTGVSERFFRFLARKTCALIMGFPVDSLSPDPPDGLALTAPYFRTGYVLATVGAPRALHDIPRNASIAVGMATVPDFYLVGYFGKVPPYRPDVFQTQEQALDALARGETRFAMVWDPSVARFATHHPRLAIGTTRLPFPHAAWGVAALYAPPFGGIARRFDAAVARLRASGTLAAITRSSAVETTK